ncbi:MAG: hypothetical protein ACI4TK_06665 [Agathobacter sp.]
MNAKRRKRISEIIEQLEGLSTEIEEVMNEEQEALDNLPESLQYSERGEQMEEYISSLEDAMNYVSEAGSSLQEID